MIITSLQNPRVKQMVALRNRRERKRSGLMTVEGYEELSLAVESGLLPQAVFYCPALFHADHIPQPLLTLHTEQIEVSVEVFQKMAYRENPDGWLALYPAIGDEVSQLALQATPFILVAEGVEKPGNLGAMLRTADAAGVHAVIAADPVTDWGNPNIVRASKGTLFSLPVAEGDSSTVLNWLHDHQIKIIAATPDTDEIYTNVDMRGGVAIAVGSEKYGLSDQWLQKADVRVKIPMFGRVNSLNVAGSAALFMYEVVRQRANFS